MVPDAVGVGRFALLDQTRAVPLEIGAIVGGTTRGCELPEQPAL
jgi:hypothetical protein